MSTTTITEPRLLKGRDLEKLDTSFCLNAAMEKIICENKELYQNVGNRELIESLKL